LGPSPHFSTTLETTFSLLSFGKRFMKIRSAVPENGCLVFFDGREKTKNIQKKQKKTSVKHIRIRLIGGCVNKSQMDDDDDDDELVTIWFIVVVDEVSCSRCPSSEVASPGE